MKDEIRKLQELGGSLYLSLPSLWTTSFNLRKGSPVFITSDEGELRIFPSQSKKEGESFTLVKFTKGVFRELIREYLLGTDIIRIKKQSPFSILERKQISDHVNSLLNFEVVEETSDSITIQNLKSDIPIKKLISRIYFLTKTMLEDLISTDKEVLNSIVERDKSVGKFYFAIIAHQRKLLTQKWSKEFSFTEIMDLRLLIERIEQIGDEIKFSAKFLLEGNKIKKEEIEFLSKKYEESFNAYVNKDVAIASNFWENEKNDKKKITNDKLLKIYDLIKDISDLVI